MRIPINDEKNNPASDVAREDPDRKLQPIGFWIDANKGLKKIHATEEAIELSEADIDSTQKLPEETTLDKSESISQKDQDDEKMSDAKQVSDHQIEVKDLIDKSGFGSLKATTHKLNINFTSLENLSEIIEDYTFKKQVNGFIVTVKNKV